jgi:hypothetical protein
MLKIIAPVFSFNTQKKKRIFMRLCLSRPMSVIGGKLGAAQRLLRPCNCGRMPVISITPDDEKLIQVCCHVELCTVCYFNPECYNLKQAAQSWNKKGRFLYNRWIKGKKFEGPVNIAQYNGEWKLTQQEIDQAQETKN